MGEEKTAHLLFSKTTMPGRAVALFSGDTEIMLIIIIITMFYKTSEHKDISASYSIVRTVV